MSSAAAAVAPTKERHPVGLRFLFMTEMWERFSYYLMIAIFYQYLVDSQTGGMAWDGKRAANVVGSYLAGVYLTPFLGAIIAERAVGYRVCIAAGGLFMCLGHVLLALPGDAMLYAALIALVVGNGLFKPSMSTLVGRLYPAGSPLRDRGYTIFYMSVNVGAFICAFVASYARNRWGWHAAFGTAGVGMLIGVVTFLAGTRHVRPADMGKAERAARPKESIGPLFAYCLGPAVATGVLGFFLASKGHLGKLDATTGAFLFACLPIIAFYLATWRKLTDLRERGRVSALFAIFAVVIVFWMVFKQSSTALTAWATSETDRQPGVLVEPITGLTPNFAESATPEYFYNAGPEVARPDPASFAIVSEEEYARLQAAKQLAVVAGKPTPVTQAIYDKVYARATAETPRLPAGEPLKLVNTELFQSINPGFVILLSPVMVGLWSLLARRRREPTMQAKIGLGLFITGCSALVMVGAAQGVHDAGGAKVSAWWLFATYGVMTVGELCLSPIGLSLISRQAPRRITAFMMGGWYIAISIGNKLSGVAGGLYHSMDHRVFFAINAGVTIAAAIVIWLMLPWLRRQMEDTPVPDEPREVSAEVVPAAGGTVGAAKPTA